MSKQSRFIKSVISTAKMAEVELPWTRGPRRAEAMARRNGQTALRKSA
ncbi:hypothetical protein GCM10011415_09090 [Salipiger pallidus]|uniref:Uncharacterized protein n=1 Tax=Salipiger pallidus TaxID=1775170 RepID=A0A8J2ZHU2_9RHOB|nr:hypothetical protein [Salipiger pallidus]GGG64664.1 hypothetical protein GCM10011415_09090 [Salipiger pallidus]